MISVTSIMMLVNILHVALLAAPAIASPLSGLPTISKRSFLDDTIKDVLKDIIYQTDSLARVVSKFTGNIDDAAPILDASSRLQSSLKNGTITIKGADTLSLAEVLAILPSVTSLNSAVENVSEVLIRKRPVFDKAQLSPIVLGQVQDQRAAAQSLINVLITKLPRYLPTALGTTLSAPSIEALDDAIAVYERPARASGRFVQTL